MPGSTSLDESGQYRTIDNLESRIDVHTRFSTAGRSWFGWLLQRLDLKPGERVLDIGSGPGTMWRTVAAGALPDVEVILVDQSIGMARAAFATTGNPCVVADAEDLPFPDRCFEVVLAAHMLYHVPRLNDAIAEVRRVLKPDGRLIAATNGAGHMGELDRLSGGEPPELSFSLENGADRLSPFFNAVSLELYDDELHITDAGAAVNYLRSYRSIDDGQAAIVRSAVEASIASHGWFQVSKATGAFIATDWMNRT